MPQAQPQNASATAAVQLAEIRQLVTQDLPALPVFPTDAYADMGAWAPVLGWLAAGQHNARPAFDRPRIALFAAGHDPAPTHDYTAQLERLGPLAQAANADLKVYDLGHNDDENAQGESVPALPLHDGEAAHAMAYGMMAVQPGLHLVALTALHPAAAQAGANVMAALQNNSDPWQALITHGGLDIAAMTGCIIAARLARVPVLTEGTAAQAACAILEALKTGATAHCLTVTDLPLGQTNATGGIQAALGLPVIGALVRAY